MSRTPGSVRPSRTSRRRARRRSSPGPSRSRCWDREVVRAVRDSGPVGAAVLAVEVGVAVSPALGGLDVGEPDAARAQRRPRHRPLVAGHVDALHRRACRQGRGGGRGRSGHGRRTAAHHSAGARRRAAGPRPAHRRLARRRDAVAPRRSVGRAAVAGRGAAAGCAVAVGAPRQRTRTPGRRRGCRWSPALRAWRTGVVVWSCGCPSLGQATGRMHRLPTCRTPIVTAGARAGEARVLVP